MGRFVRPQVGSIRTEDPVFSIRLKSCLERTLPEVMKKINDTGRLDSFRLNWKDGADKKPHIYWDSDTAKVLEAMAYCLALSPDPELEKAYDQWVDLICSAQQPDGYLNSYFTQIEPENRWKHLSFAHELYCAGHLIEAAVAGFECLGKTKLLDAICRYTDYIDSVFGREAGKRRGWPGHEEIELALLRLYRVTGKQKYLDLAAYFINDRGTEPNVFMQEDPENFTVSDARGFQAHLPVREQMEAEGHAVRAIYLYTGMADLADLYNDAGLLEAVIRLFDSIWQKKIYLTGGIGSTFFGEAFTIGYDLANGSLMYAESCAAMGLVQLAVRLFNITGNSFYLEAAELALYNGVLSGISLEGTRFFYTNYLEVDENLQVYNFGAKERQEWFDCSCCPTSFSRFIPQIATFLWSAGDNEISLNIPAACRADLQLKDGRKVSCEVRGNYPYDGKIQIIMNTPGEYTLNLRIPQWCRKYTVKVNGASADCIISRFWQPEDVVELDLDMPVAVVRANLKVTGNSGRIALKRGPVVYALEEQDQLFPVRELIIDPSAAFELVPAAGLPEGTPAITGKAFREYFSNTTDLYMEESPEYQETGFTAIPYALWQNRTPGNMAVWVRAKSNLPG